MKRKQDKEINRVRICFPALSQNESLARVAVSGVLMQLNPCLDELCDIKTAVSEAVTNAIVHAYKETAGEVTVVVKLYPERVAEITVRDKGCGIEDIAQAMEPLFSTGDGEERAGLGFTVMESFMDEVAVRSQPGRGTSVRLKKKLRRRELT